MEVGFCRMNTQKRSKYCGRSLILKPINSIVFAKDKPLIAPQSYNNLVNLQKNYTLFYNNA